MGELIHRCFARKRRRSYTDVFGGNTDLLGRGSGCTSEYECTASSVLTVCWRSTVFRHDHGGRLFVEKCRGHQRYREQHRYERMCGPACAVGMASVRTCYRRHGCVLARCSPRRSSHGVGNLLFAGILSAVDLASGASQVRCCFGICRFILSQLWYLPTRVPPLSDQNFQGKSTVGSSIRIYAN